MIKHLDPTTRTVRFEQRNWRIDIDEPKTERSTRILALGALCDRYLDWIAKLDRRGANDWMFPETSDRAKPMWDSGVREGAPRGGARRMCLSRFGAELVATRQHHVAAGGRRQRTDRSG